MILNLFVVIISTLIFFTPTIVAYKRKLNRRFICFWINLLFGWTAIGWVVLLIWSFASGATEE